MKSDVCSFHGAQVSQADWGVLDSTSVLDVAQCQNAATMLTADGLYQFVGAQPEAGKTTGKWQAVSVQPALPVSASSGKLVLSTSSALVGVVYPTGVVLLSCSGSSCTSKAVSASLGRLHEATCVGGDCNTMWLASDNGLSLYSGGVVKTLLAKRQFAVASSSDSRTVFSGNDQHVYHWDATTGRLLRKEWVTIISTGAGGVYADSVWAMVFSPDGTLFVATHTAVNVRWTNGTVSRVDGLGGLPMTNLTSIALGTTLTTDAHTAGLPFGVGDVSYQLVVGSTQGLATVQVGGVPGASQSPPIALTPPSLWSNWRYFNGPRYLPTHSAAENATGNAVFAVAGGAAQAANAGSRGVLVATDGGVAVLQPVLWTLAEKAAAMETVQARHNRYGMSGGCSLTSFGNYSSCINHGAISDNNGLWTSLVVVAEAMRFAVTGAQAAQSAAAQFLQGMHLLVKVTGVHGLMGRSAIAPGETHGPGDTYHNSSTPGLQGWQWKGDASSDEVTGHVFAYPLAAALLGDTPLPPGPWNTTENTAGASAQNTALELLHGIVSYVVASNFTLVDVTGEATQWGHWDPPTLNLDRSWSDGRGVNSLQMLAYLQAALTTSPDASAWSAAYATAVAELTSSVQGHDYYGNLLNLKIKTPVDDNYSDDELTFLPYYLFAACNAASSTEDADLDTTLLRSSLRRTFDFVRPWRSNLWGTMWLATGGGQWARGENTPLAAACSAVGNSNSASDTASAVHTTSTSQNTLRLRRRAAATSADIPQPRDWSTVPFASSVGQDILWNLRTWPVEAVNWPVQNSNRQDVFFRPGQNRAFQSHTDSVRVLPANERAQLRWNGNPHQLDGGNGMSETGPGAWLLPYWMARYHGILAAPATE